MTIKRINVQTGEVEEINETAPSFPPTAEEKQAEAAQKSRRASARDKLTAVTGMTIDEIRDALA